MSAQKGVLGVHVEEDAQAYRKIYKSFPTRGIKFKFRPDLRVLGMEGELGQEAIGPDLAERHEFRPGLGRSQPG